MSIIKIPPYILDSTLDYTFNNVTATGNLVSLNANLGNAASANYFVGNGSLLTGLPAGYANSNAAAYLPTYSGVLGGTLSTNAQPNITSVGSLASLTVTGLTTATGGVKTANINDNTGTVTIQTKYNSQAGDVGIVGNLVVGTGGTGNVTATYFIGDGSQLTGISGGGGTNYANSNVATYLPTYTGNLSPGNLTVATFTSLGSVSNVSITGGSSGQVLRTDGTGNLSWVDQSAGGGGGGLTFTNSTTAPTSPNEGDQWYDTTTGTTYTYVSDAGSSQWVELGTVPLTGDTSPKFTTGKAIAMSIVFGG